MQYIDLRKIYDKLPTIIEKEKSTTVRKLAVTFLFLRMINYLLLLCLMRCFFWQMKVESVWGRWRGILGLMCC